MRQKGIVLIAALSVSALTLLSVGCLQIGYYNEFDLFGPVSKYATYFFVTSFLIALIMILVLKNRKVSPAIALIPFLLLVFLKYVLPDLLETYYATNFSDAPVHLKKGLFVTKTGHSDPNVDSYFDLQPGFFWGTSIILNVVCGAPPSIVSPVSLFLVKWFHLLTIAVYIPLLYIFYKRLLGKPSMIGLALLLQFSIDPNHFHYAAQPYGNALYWLSITLVLMLSCMRDKRLTLLLLISGSSLIFIHQGLTIFLIILIAAMLFYPLPFRIIHRDHRGFSERYWILLAILVVSWLSYIIFVTGHTFETFVGIFKNVIEEFVNLNASLLSAGVLKPNPLWMQVVTCKALYLALLVLIGLISSFINAWKSNDDVDKAVFSMQLFTVIILGSIGVALGGRGYIERLLIIVPLITYSFVKLVFNSKWHIPKHIPKVFIYALVAIALTTLIFLGITVYFSGRNFQSISYSDLAQENFIVTHDPNNVLNLYKKIKVSTLNEGATYGFQKGVLYVITPQDTIYSIYYTVGESSKIQSVYTNLSKDYSQIYDNMVAKIMKGPTR
jgi:hypothetical protein